jgi:hypothetical protein
LYRPGLVCSRGYWSCDLLTGLPVLQTHRPGLACSRDYWSCSPQPLTGLPVLQTHGLVLPAQGVTGLAACSQGYLSCKLTGPVLLAQGITGLAAPSRSQSYLSCKLTAWSCCSRNYWSCSSQLAHRVTYLANSRLDSLFGPIAKSTETCSQQRNLLCISNIDNWCLRGLLFCRLLVVMLHIDLLFRRPFHSSSFLARSSSLIC